MLRFAIILLSGHVELSNQFQRRDEGMQVPRLIDDRRHEDSKYKPHLPRISKYPNWDFFASECLNDKISVEDGQCLNSH